MPVFASIGIAIYPNDAIDRDSLMSHADIALYRAKVGRPRHLTGSSRRPWAPTFRERRHIEHDLLHAISRGELRLVYQPQKTCDSGELVGFEALLRWQQPDTRRRFRPTSSSRSPRKADDPADRRMGAAQRLPRGGELGAPRLSWRSTSRRCNCIRRKFSHLRARDPARRPDLPGTAWNSKSPRRRWCAT